jgi:hypothetical protein
VNAYVPDVPYDEVIYVNSNEVYLHHKESSLCRHIGVHNMNAFEKPLISDMELRYKIPKGDKIKQISTRFGD